jgi:hypothetical protein
MYAVIIFVRLAGGSRSSALPSTMTSPLATSIKIYELAETCGGDGIKAGFAATSALKALNTSKETRRKDKDLDIKDPTFISRKNKNEQP